MKKEGKVAALVLAAGSGKRMNSSVKKQYLLIYDKPILYYTLKAFEESAVDEVILVTGQDEIDYCRQEIVDKYGFKKVSHIIAGGKERYDSVYQGLLHAECDYVLIHDGARPFITPEVIEKNITCIIKEEACVTAVPSKDTVKISDSDGFIVSTPARSTVWIIQTPQSFAYPLVKEAYDRMFASGETEGVTDDAMVVEKYMDRKIRLLQGEYTNIKITTPEDLEIAKVFLKK